MESGPRGRMAVTPVRTGPLPTTSLPEPLMRVVCPTSTPATSVMAFKGPGVPSKGTPRSRARGSVLLRTGMAGPDGILLVPIWAITASDHIPSTEHAAIKRTRIAHLPLQRCSEGEHMLTEPRYG